MKQAKTLTDVIKIMNDNYYDFIDKYITTISINGKRRHVLLFERRHKYVVTNTSIQSLIGNRFAVEKYSNGCYYQVYKCL